MPWSDQESEADEHELSLDEHGRTAISGTCDYRPRVWDGVVAEAAVPGLVADCKAAYLKVTTQTAMTGITYSTNATYWVGADTTPRTALERFALSPWKASTSICPFAATSFQVATRAPRCANSWLTSIDTRHRQVTSG